MTKEGLAQALADLIECGVMKTAILEDGERVYGFSDEFEAMPEEAREPEWQRRLADLYARRALEQP